MSYDTNNITKGKTMTVIQKAKEVAKEANSGNMKPLEKFLANVFDKMHKDWLQAECLMAGAGLKDVSVVYSIWEQEA